MAACSLAFRPERSMVVVVVVKTRVGTPSAARQDSLLSVDESLNSLRLVFSSRLYLFDLDQVGARELRSNLKRTTMSLEGVEQQLL